MLLNQLGVLYGCSDLVGAFAIVKRERIADKKSANSEKLSRYKEPSLLKHFRPRILVVNLGFIDLGLSEATLSILLLAALPLEPVSCPLAPRVA